MKITVILCTYNRSGYLRTALDSVAASILPESVGWYVLVVDNNSNDQTREVVEEYCAKYPDHFKYLFEPTPGKSHALNAGILAADGDVLVFMDDDVTVEPTWLQNLTAALSKGDWAGTGGRIILQWPASVPEWLAKEGPLARHGFPGFDQGTEQCALIGPPFGTNMAFRKTMFEKHGGFRLDLGPSPHNEIRNEDTEFGRRLLSAGERIRYEPDAIVYHPVPAEKLTKKHLLKWGFDKGRGDAREINVRPSQGSRQLAAWIFRWLTAFDPVKRFHAKVIVWEKAGALREWWHKSFGGKKADVRNSQIVGKLR
jgi:glycosyltransferase involved in cell wall biosynthesis